MWRGVLPSSSLSSSFFSRTAEDYYGDAPGKTVARGIFAEAAGPDYGYLCLLPWMIGFLSFVLGPMLFRWGLSFFHSDLLTSTFFVGFDNYRDLFREDLF